MKEPQHGDLNGDDDGERKISMKIRSIPPSPMIDSAFV